MNSVRTSLPRPPLPPTMPLRFLIADDNPAHLKLTANVVLFLGGQSRTASNGEEAIALVRQEEFDVVLLDLWMPRMGGLVAATRMLRELENRPSRPRIVAVTGDISHERHALCRAVGMDGFVTKPCDLNRFRHKLQEVVVAGHCWPEGPTQPTLDIEKLWSALDEGSEAQVRRFEEQTRRIRLQLRALPNEDHDATEAAAVRDFAVHYGFIRLARALHGLLRTTSDQERETYRDQLTDEIREFENTVIAAHESLHDIPARNLLAAA